MVVSRLIWQSGMGQVVNGEGHTTILFANVVASQTAPAIGAGGARGWSGVATIPGPTHHDIGHGVVADIGVPPL